MPAWHGRTSLACTHGPGADTLGNGHSVPVNTVIAFASRNLNARTAPERSDRLRAGDSTPAV